MDKITLWKDRDKGTIDPELFSVKAKELAKRLAEDNKNSKGEKANRRTQLRKFYDEVLRLDSEAKSGSDDQWERILLPRVHMLTAKAAYAMGRDFVSIRFLNFIEETVKQVQEPKDLRIFAMFFEAMMGFYRQYGPSN